MTRRHLHISDENVSLPPAWIMLSTVVLGAKGSGKTSFGAVVAEEVTKIRQRFCAIDLKGDFWGLKSSADGKSPAIPAVVFGGDHADLPLEEGAGKFLGELVAGMEQSVILDFENFSKGKQVRFLGEFFAALYDANREPLLVIMDEAQRYSPQKPISPEAHVCLGAVEDLVKLGRKHGLGVLLLTQRGAGLNKEVSEICDAMVVFRTPGTLDQERARGWLNANGFDWPMVATKDGRERPLVAQLGTGQALLASAHPDLDLLPAARQIRRRETFDSSATPKIGERRKEPRALAKPEIEAIKTRMVETIERAKADDPRLLKKRVAELEARLAKASPILPAIVTEVETKIVEVPMLTEKDFQRYEAACARFEKAIDKQIKELAPFQERLVEVNKNLLAKMSEAMRLARPTRVTPSRSVPRAPARQELPPPRVDGSVTALQQRVLDALAWFAAVGIREPRRAAVAAVARSKQGGHFNNQVSALHTSGMVTYPSGGRLLLTKEGAAVANAPSSAPTLAAFHEMALGVLKGLQRPIVEALIAVYPESLSRDELIERLGKKGGGHFNNVVSSVKTMEFLSYPEPGRVAATDVLFPSGLL